MTTRPPRISGTPSGDDSRPTPGQGWAVLSRQSQQPPSQRSQQPGPQPYDPAQPHRPHVGHGAPQGFAPASHQPQHAFPAQPYDAAHRPAVEHRVRERDGARRRVGGVTAALAVAALVGTGAAVVATSANGATTASTTSTSSGTTVSGTSSDTSSSTTSDSSGTSSGVSSSNQSSVASTSGS